MRGHDVQGEVRGPGNGLHIAAVLLAQSNRCIGIGKGDPAEKRCRLIYKNITEPVLPDHSYRRLQHRLGRIRGLLQ